MAKQSSTKLEIANRLLDFDIQWHKQHDKPIIGVDEVGRGCLAGPVVACALYLKELYIDNAFSALGTMLSGLNDSKKVLPGNRTKLAKIISKNCLYAIAEASVKEIDQLNIRQASLLAMSRAVNQLNKLLSGSPMNPLVIVDGNTLIPKIAFDQHPLIKGDGLSATVAAASIMAKVHRDNIMTELAQIHPKYQWHSNKGYGSKAHLEAITEHGLTNWHRKTFCKQFVLNNSEASAATESCELSV